MANIGEEEETVEMEPFTTDPLSEPAPEVAPAEEPDRELVPA